MIAQNAEHFQDALALVLKLPAIDRLKLVEQVISSVESELSAETQADSNPNRVESSQTGHWGQDLVALLNRLDMSDWENMDIPDVAEWVHQLRHQQSDQHAQYWQGEE